MLRTKLLLFRAKALANGNKTPRTTQRYGEAKHFGIIFSIEDKPKSDIISRFAQQLKSDGKQVSVLSYLPRKKENPDYVFDFFTKSDISLWGHFTSEEVLSFAEQRFDYLLYIDHVPNPVFENFLAISKAKCRVGKFRENHDRFFEMMITTHKEGNTKELIDEMYRYIKVLG